MSVLTFLVVAVVVYGVVSRRYDRALALGGATSAGVALSFGSLVVPTFYAVAAGGLVVLLVGYLLRRGRPSDVRLRQIPGISLLLAFLAWGTAVTLVAPLLFDGRVTVWPATRILRAGLITSSNIAQISYVILGIAVIVIIARTAAAGAQTLGLSLGVALGLSFWRYLSQTTGIPFPEGVFDNNPTMEFIETAPGGAPRPRGIFVEPSSLAVSALVAVAYSLSRLARTSGLRRIPPLLLGALAVYLGLVSTATTFVIGGIAMAAFAGAVFALGFLMRRTRFSAGIAAIACLGALGAAFWLPWAAQAVGVLVDDKLGTSSYDERTSADAASYAAFLDSYGLGVGLGASRGSSFLPTLLSTVGIVGVLLFAAAIVAIVRRSVGALEYRPVLWGLIAYLLVKMISGPDLSDTSGLLWLCLGLLAHGAVRAVRAPDDDTARSSDPLRRSSRPRPAATAASR